MFPINERDNAKKGDKTKMSGCNVPWRWLSPMYHIPVFLTLVAFLLIWIIEGILLLSSGEDYKLLFIIL